MCSANKGDRSSGSAHTLAASSLPHSPSCARHVWAGMPLAIRSAELLVFAAALAIFVHNVHAVWQFTADDAFITLRYARNLAMGYGPTYNAGRPPIEGCTAFLWMLL